MKSRHGGLRLKAISLGWIAALLTGAAILPLAKSAYTLLADTTIERGVITRTTVVISMASGFLAYLVGGYVAARASRSSGGINGAATAVLGAILGLGFASVLSPFRVTFFEDLALLPAEFGPTGGTLAATGLLFCVNLFGGYVGGKLGEPPPEASSIDRRKRT